MKSLYTKIVVIITCLSCSAGAHAQFKFDDLLKTGAAILQNATSTTHFEASELIGTWTYYSPAIAMKGDNALANIGSVAASGTIEKKLATYYEKVGIQNSVLVVNDDLSFEWTLGKIKLTGTISKTADSDQLAFIFSAFGKVKIGTISCIASKSGSIVSLTFDSSKLIGIAQQVTSIASNSTFKTVNSLLSNYKDLYVGLKMQKK